MIPYPLIEEAAWRISDQVNETPLSYDPQHDIYLKWENHQRTGSFKIRGAMNRVLAMPAWERQRGLVTASAGNHGQGVALAAYLVNTRAIIFASMHASQVKIAAIRALGAEVRLVPGGYTEAERAAIQFARSNQMTWISAYNDELVIAGQGTLGREIRLELPEKSGPHTWIIPIGGGGLAAGIGVAVKEAPSAAGRPAERLVAVQSEASPYFQAIFRKTGSLVDPQDEITELPSLADGLAGKVERGSVTVPLVKRYIDEIRLVTESEIAQAIVYASRWYGERIEGAAATALAAVISGKIPARPAVVVISGGNIDAEVHERLLAETSLDQAGVW